MKQRTESASWRTRWKNIPRKKKKKKKTKKEPRGVQGTARQHEIY